MKKILFICTANVCRSPLAEGYFRYLLEANRQPEIEVSSAGILALSGARAFPCAVSVAENFGFDLSGHTARRLTMEVAEEADLILCMETWQAGSVIDIDPKFMGKVQLLGSHHPGSNRLFQIPDPRSFTVQETAKTFDLIRPSVETVLQKLR